MPEDRLKVAVVVGSTREGRFGPVVARWFVSQAERRPDMELDVIDLVKARLPATIQRGTSEELAAYAGRIGAADAFVIVTPEYNHGYPASLKQAIDLLREEWWAKPVAFVSYGGISGGLRAVEQLRQVFAELHAVTIRDSVILPRARRQFDADGNPVDPDWVNSAAAAMLDQLAWWAISLREARQKRPYVV